MQTVLPFGTSLALHLAIVLAGVVTYRAVQDTRRPISIDQPIVPDLAAVSGLDVSGGVPHPGFLDPNRDAAQQEFENIKEVGGFASRPGRSLAMELPATDAGSQSDYVDPMALGLNASTLRRPGGAASTSADGGGGMAVFGIPGGGGGGTIRGIFAPGIGPNAKKIVFVLDATGSMIASFDALRVQLRATLQSLKPSYSFDILFINERDPAPLAPSLVYATPENKRKAIEFADAMAPRGSTNPLPALRKALELKPDLIYLLIDPSDFPDKLAVLDLVKARAGDGHTKLNIIAYEGNDPENNRFLRDLAKSTGGVYRFVTERELRESR